MDFDSVIPLVQIQPAQPVECLDAQVAFEALFFFIAFSLILLFSLRSCKLAGFWGDFP